MSKISKKTVSVFIPTYNGEKYISQCIDAVLSQKLPKNYRLELLVTDSGSTDSTVDIVKGYGKKIRFEQIPNSEFGHGKTRAQAAQNASGEFILFLTQDATPANDRWLINMIEPFFVSERVGCVFGRQIPRAFSVPTIKREVASVFGGLGTGDTIVIYRYKSLVDGSKTNELNAFFSDANSAVRRELVLSSVPFRDLPYSEDQALAEDMQKKGYFKAYSPLGSVWHSNEYTAKEYYHRKFDEYIGLQESIDYKINPSLKTLTLGWIKPTMKDISFTLKDPEYNIRAKIKFAIGSVLYNIAEKAGRYQAGKHYANYEMRKKISLEYRNKN